MYRLSLIFVVSAFLAFACGKKQETQNVVSDTAQEQGQVTVNFVAIPSLSAMLNSLDHLQESDFSAVQAKNYVLSVDANYKYALNLGVAVADGIISVKAKNKDAIVAISADILSIAEVLGIKDSIVMIVDSMNQLIQGGSFEGLVPALESCQSQVENTMMALSDVDQLTFIQIGGWVEGLFWTTKLIQKNYKQDYTKVIFDKKGFIDHLLSNMCTFSESLNQIEGVQTIKTSLTDIQGVLNQTENDLYSQEQINKLVELSQGILATFK